jgi:hypothetical protein
LPDTCAVHAAVDAGTPIYVLGGTLEAGMSHASEGSTVVESFRAPCAKG